MEISSDSLRRYYSSLPDEALLDLDRSGLTEMARACYDNELARRNLRPEPHDNLPVWTGNDTPAACYRADSVFTPEGGWLEDAVCVCAFETGQGIGHSSEAERAREVLEAAGIPCHMSVEQLETPHARSMRQHECRVMVPAALSLQATSVLDIGIFNPKLEVEWKTHFEQLSDDELCTFDAESLCAGLLDRAARLKRAYVGEVSRRKLRPRPADR